MAAIRFFLPSHQQAAAVGAGRLVQGLTAVVVAARAQILPATLAEMERPIKVTLGAVALFPVLARIPREEAVVLAQPGWRQLVA
jgi:hypothetical protein